MTPGRRLIAWCRRRVGRVGWTSASVVAMMATATRVWPPHQVPTGPTAVVIEAPFRDTLVSRGTVSSGRFASYGSTIAGVQAKILDLVPEGTAVVAGQVLIRFDAAPFEEAVARESAALAQAEAEVLHATEGVRQEQLRASIDTDSARADVSQAEAALANEREGKGPLAIAEAEVAASDAARELARARSSSADMQALLDKGFVTRLEADHAVDAVRQAEERGRLAALRLQTLRTFEEPATLEKAQAALTAAGRNLGGMTASTASRLVQVQATLALARARCDEAKARVAHAQDDVARTVVRSGVAGLVVYDELFFGTDKRKPQPGDQVWPNQSIVAVPDSTELVVTTRVREVDVHKVGVGAPVVVRVEAYPDLQLAGSVALIGALAEEDPTRAGAKFFAVTVAINQQDARLRTGMSARVDVQVASLPRALTVPIEAIEDRADGSAAVCVVSGRQCQPRSVVVAARNERLAAIASGLRAGDVVRLVDPARPPVSDRDQR